MQIVNALIGRVTEEEETTPTHYFRSQRAILTAHVHIILTL